MNTHKAKPNRLGFLGLQSRVTRQLLKWVLLVGGIAALIVSAGEAYLTYQERLDRISLHLDSIGRYASHPLTQSLWAFDTNQVEVQLKGFVQMPEVSAVRLRQENAPELHHGAESLSGNTFQRSFPLVHEENGKQHNLGTLTLIKDLEEDRQELMQSLVISFLGNSLVILLIVLVTLAVYHSIVRIRLAVLAKELAHIQPDDLRSAGNAGIVPQPSRDEIDELAASIVNLKITGGRALHELDERNSALNRLLEELSESKALLLTIIDTTPIRVFWKDADLRYLGCNPLFAQDAGKRTPAELIGKDDYEMTWSAQADLYRADDRKVMATGTAKIGFEEPQTTPDGHTIWLRTSKVPLRGKHGDVIGVLGIYDDITRHKQAEAELAQHRLHLEELVEQRTADLVATEAKASHILQSSADGLYGVDLDGRITFINLAACQMLGYTTEQVIGQSAHELFHHSKPDGSPYPVDACVSHMALQHGQEIRIDNEVYWHADGHAVPIMFSIHPMIQNGQNVGAVVSFVDMSEQRAAAQARERAIVAAENLARMRSEFLSNMSHEIRTPINGVLGFAEIGYRNYQDSEKARNAFEKIRTSGKRLLGVVNDILDFSRIEAGKLHIERTAVALNELIEQTVEMVEAQAHAKHLDLRVERVPDFPETCLGDPLRMGQVLLNLLSNAVKFTEQGSIIMTASCADDRLLFRVADTGIGMNEEQMRQLFTPFTQADGSISRRFGGSGLGLTIAKRIAELMEGDIRAESQPGKGSTFEFRLPYLPVDETLAVPDSVSLHQASPVGQQLAGMTILVAEDEIINQQVIEMNLADEGARVVMVSNGLQAVERILQDGRAAYDIVLMDVQMPEMDGLEATQRILELAPDLPIIGQTANAFAEDREKCLAVGMVSYIAKPTDPQALVSLVLQQVMARRNG